jgi:soluble lytic murein transglycosylase-like protein
VSGDVVLVHDGSGVTQLALSSIREYKVEEYLEPTPAPIVPPPNPAVAVPTSTDGAVDPKQLVRDVVAKQNLPPEMVALVNSVMKQESGFHANALSPKGAIGLMQLMPGTARDLGANPKDPAQNVDAGTRYLTALLKKYEGHDDQVIRALAAYNAGPGAVDKYDGVPPYRETRDYVRKIVKNYQAQTAQSGE